MFRLNLMLMLAVMASALMVVTAQHKSRRLYVALQQEDQAARQYREDYDKLLLEQSTQGMHSRIEREATQQLKMKTPAPERTRVVTQDGDAVIVEPPKEE